MRFKNEINSKTKNLSLIKHNIKNDNKTNNNESIDISLSLINKNNNNNTEHPDSLENTDQTNINFFELENIKKKIKKISLDKKTTKAKFLNYSSNEIFKSLLFFDKCINEDLKAKDQLYLLAEKRINDYVDVLNILKLTEMFEILKKIFLNEKSKIYDLSI